MQITDVTAELQPQERSFWAIWGRVARAVGTRPSMLAFMPIAVVEAGVRLHIWVDQIPTSVPASQNLAHVFLGEIAEVVTSEHMDAKWNRGARMLATGAAGFVLNAAAEGVQYKYFGGIGPWADTQGDLVAMGVGVALGWAQDPYLRTPAEPVVE